MLALETTRGEEAKKRKAKSTKYPSFTTCLVFFNPINFSYKMEMMIVKVTRIFWSRKRIGESTSGTQSVIR